MISNSKKSKFGKFYEWVGGINYSWIFDLEEYSEIGIEREDN